jgi:hypothetical protein
MSGHRRNPVMVAGMLFCSGIICFCAATQDLDTVSTQHGIIGDTVLTNDTTGIARPAAPGVIDSLSRPEAGDTAVSAPQKPAVTEEKKAESLKLVKRTYGRKQVLLATVMMIFVVLIMTAAQQWNPR